MTLKQRRIIDADGHVAEDTQAIIARMPKAYRDKARVQPFHPFPPFDHLHAAHLVDMPPGAFNRKVGPDEWLAFLDEVVVIVGHEAEVIRREHPGAANEIPAFRARALVRPCRSGGDEERAGEQERGERGEQP